MPQLILKPGDEVVLNRDVTAYTHGGKRAHTATVGYRWAVHAALPREKGRAQKYKLVSVEAKGVYTCEVSETAIARKVVPGAPAPMVAAAANARPDQNDVEIDLPDVGPNGPGLWEPGEFEAMLERVSAEAKSRPRAEDGYDTDMGVTDTTTDVAAAASEGDE